MKFCLQLFCPQRNKIKGYCYDTKLKPNFSKINTKDTNLIFGKNSIVIFRDCFV